uniref:Subtilisin-like protease n=1 Tax=Cajanus cajan TaxID=3821 RepID=A0A151S7V0_CAJCA|nr:Subtilisin-like protease [Cajanus cajan]
MNNTLEYRSPIDSDGHDTHTASITVGRYVFLTSTMGYAKGMAAEMSPLGSVLVYKVYWNINYYDSDILAAFDAVVADSVEVISLSVGGMVVPYHLDVIIVGAFEASKDGVFVSASMGNNGPGVLTVTNVAPWMLAYVAKKSSIQVTICLNFWSNSRKPWSKKMSYRSRQHC